MMGQGACSSGSFLLGILGAPDRGSGGCCCHPGVGQKNSYDLQSAFECQKRSRSWIYTSTFQSSNNLQGRHCGHPHFPVEESEPPRGLVTSPRPQSWDLTEVILTPKPLLFTAVSFTCLRRQVSVLAAPGAEGGTESYGGSGGGAVFQGRDRSRAGGGSFLYHRWHQEAVMVIVGGRE